MLSPAVVDSVQLLGYTLGDFSTPLAALGSAFALGVLFGVIPLGGAELVVLAIGGVKPRGLLLPLVMVFTLGHVLGKAAWYWLGTRHDRVRHPWLRRQIDRALRLLTEYPKLGTAALGSSALVSVPPFHLSAIAAGAVNCPFALFMTVAFVGRAVRFAVIAIAPQLAFAILRWV